MKFQIGDRVIVDGHKHGEVAEIVRSSRFPYRIQFDYPDNGYNLDYGFHELNVSEEFGSNGDFTKFYEADVLVKLSGAELEYIYRTMNGEVSLFDVPVDIVELTKKLKQAGETIQKYAYVKE